MVRSALAGKFHQNCPRFMLSIGFNAPFECYEQAVQQIVGDARPPLTGEPVNACLAPSPSWCHRQKSPSGRHRRRGVLPRAV